MTTSPKHSRRAFLKGLGASAAFLPMLEAEQAAAQAFPTNFVVFHKNNGMHRFEFFPSYGTPPAGGKVRLSDIALPRILQPLDRHKGHITVLGGVEQKSFKDIPFYNGHASASHTLTGQAAPGAETNKTTQGSPYFGAGGISLDQWLAREFAKTTPDLPFKTLNLGTAPGSKISWLEAGKSVSDEQSPVSAFNRIFGLQALAPADQERLRSDRRSVIDYVRGELGRFKWRLGTADRQSIEYHLTSVRELENRLAVLPSAAACNKGTAPVVPSSPSFNQHMPILLKAHMDVMAVALACGITRVSTLKVGQGDWALLFLGSQFNVKGNDAGDPKLAMEANNRLLFYHDITHWQYTVTKEMKVLADSWWMETFGYLLDKLDAVKQGGGTLLDSTVVFLGDDMGEGRSHAQSDMPFIVAGRHPRLKSRGHYVHPGRQTPHNGVLVGLARAFGFGVETFGDPKYGNAYADLLV